MAGTNRVTVHTTCPTVHVSRVARHTHTSHPHHLIGIAGASRGPVPALPLSPFEPKGIWCLQPSLHIKESRPTASRRHSSERGRTSSCGRRLTRGGSQLKSNESARGGSQSGLASRRGGASATGAVKSRVSLNVLFLIGIHRSGSSLLRKRSERAAAAAARLLAAEEQRKPRARQSGRARERVRKSARGCEIHR